jgi:hypothetical protein
MIITVVDILTFSSQPCGEIENEVRSFGLVAAAATPPAAVSRCSIAASP